MFRALALLAACLASPPVCGQAPSVAVPGEILLDNELPLSGPQVWLHFRYGRHYHPGAVLLAEGRVVWPGGAPPQGVSGISVAEGNGPLGPRYGVRFPVGGASVFRFPIQAPAGSAELRFSLWQEVYGEPQDLLRTSLVSHLKVLPPQGRMVLRCGQVSRLAVPPVWQQAAVAPRELPERTWMYENVDLAILGREALNGVPAASLAALRRWVVGGGRLLIASAEVASAELLLGAVRAGLTPLGPDSERMPVRPPLWPGMDDDPKSAGCEVRYDGQFNIVYARYRLGLGGGVFFVPSADPNAVADVGMKVFEEPVLASPRPERSDVRVWRQPFEFFAPGSVPHERRMRAARWASIGAGCFLAMLAFACSQRTRYLAAGLALVAIGAMASLLGRFFPRPEMTLARVQRVDIPLDGRARRTTEWALCEGTWDPRGVTLRTEPGGTLTPLFFSPRELRESTVTVQGDGELVCRFASPLLPAAAPLFQSVWVEETSDRVTRTIELPGERVRLRLAASRSDGPGTLAGAIWAGDDGRRAVLAPEGSGYRCERLTDERRYIQGQFSLADEATVGAWAKALGAVLDEARRHGRGCLVRCADRLQGEGLVRVQGVETENGVGFAVECMDVAQEPWAR